MTNESGKWADPNFSSVDQSDRTVPVNLRQTGRPDIKLLISTRARKSPYWHLAIFMFIMGSGLGLSMQITVTAAQNSVPRQHMGTATSTMTARRSTRTTVR